jgi:hypothetical protein
VYQPKLRNQLIEKLYRIAEREGMPITSLLDRIVTNGLEEMERKRIQAITNDKRRWPRFNIARAGSYEVMTVSGDKRIRPCECWGWIALNPNDLERSLKKALEEQRREYRIIEEQKRRLGAA